MGCVGSRCDDNSGGKIVSHQLHRLCQPAVNHMNRRIQPQRFVYHRFQIRKLGNRIGFQIQRMRIDFLMQLVELVWIFVQKIKRPREHHGSGFVSRKHHREQLIEDLLIGQTLSFVILRAEQKGQDVFFGFLALPSLRGQCNHMFFQPAEDFLKARPGSDSAKLMLKGTQKNQRRKRAKQLQQIGAKLLDSFVLIDAKHRFDDHIQRDRLRCVDHRKRISGGQSERPFRRCVAHHGSIAAHALTMKRGRQELALTLVLRAACDEHRGPNHPPKGVRRRGRKQLWIGGEDLFVSFRRDRDDHWTECARHRQRIAVIAGHVCQRVRQIKHHPDHRQLAWAFGQRRHDTLSIRL